MRNSIKKRIEKIKIFACFAVLGLALLLLPMAVLVMGKLKVGLQKKTIKSMFHVCAARHPTAGR